MNDSEYAAQEYAREAKELEDMLIIVGNELLVNRIPIPAAVMPWWEKTQEKVHERQEREMEQQRKLNLKTSALAKLTRAEKIALGF